MITEVLLVTLGAVNTPLLEIAPVLADQATAVSAVPLMLAVNRCCACDTRVVLTGEIESTVTEPLAETAICAAVDPYSILGSVETPSVVVAPYSFPGRVET
jgi:hypothetical protein